MISDILFNARSGIENCEWADTDDLREISPALTNVKIVMHAMQAALDLTPVGGKQGNHAWKLIGAIMALDTTTLIRLLETTIEPIKQNPKQPA
jgi:hypothetical protein